MILFRKGWTFPPGSAIMIVDKISGTPPFQFSDEKKKGVAIYAEINS